MHRFVVAGPLGDTVTLDAGQSHQVATVLRLKPDDRIVVFDGSGDEAEVVLDVVERSGVMGRIIDRRPAAGEPAIAVTVHLALLKGDKLDWVVQKATEIGAAAIALLVTDRAVARDVSASRLERLQRIALEAAEQAGRGRVPPVLAPRPLHQCIAALDGPALFPWEDERRMPIGAALAQVSAAGARRLALFVGPEGGWSAAEVDLARGAGLHLVSLGPRTLRAETAALVALTLSLDHSGQLARPATAGDQVTGPRGGGGGRPGG